ncbi:MAG: hypothetical protein K8W52_24335 [Deltaproteobacteria bacterium]|nr:hypothetical protein [Deltaproteobacteria bacterium]
MEALKAPVRWLKAYWDDDDVWFFFEADDYGWVLRQVELRGPDETPQVAAALAEWPDPGRDGLEAVQAYEAKYGALADQPISAWNDFPGVAITRDEFETVWRRARAHLDRVR